MRKASPSYGPRFWMRERPPYYSNVWLFKTNRLGGSGVYVSRQANPSGVTIRAVVAGEWRVSMAGVTMEARRCDLFLALPGERIEFAQTDPTADWEWLEVQFDGAAAEEFVKEFGLDRRHPVASPLKPKEVLGIFESLHELMGRQDRVEAAIMEMVFKLMRACGDRREGCGERGIPPSDELVRKAITLLETESSLNMSVKQLAQRLRVDRTTLGRAFKRKTGGSPHRFIASYRMMRVMELLQTTALPIQVIAATSGFSNVKYFINWFRAKNKFPPGAWRRQCRGGGSNLN